MQLPALAYDHDGRSHPGTKERLQARRHPDTSHGASIARRAIILQWETQGPELSDQKRESVSKWVHGAGLNDNDQLFKRWVTHIDEPKF